MREFIKNKWKHRESWWSAEYDYAYAKIDVKDRIIFGGIGVIDNGYVNETACRAALRARFKQMFGFAPDVEKEWAGVIQMPVDDIPFIGKLSENISVAIGIIGLPYAFSAGKALAEENFHPIFSPSRNMTLQEKWKLLANTKIVSKITNYFILRPWSR